MQADINSSFCREHVDIRIINKDRQDEKRNDE
jgi:hypothetical protein